MEIKTLTVADLGCSVSPVPFVGLMIEIAMIDRTCQLTHFLRLYELLQPSAAGNVLCDKMQYGWKLVLSHSRAWTA